MQAATVPLASPFLMPSSAQHCPPQIKPQPPGGCLPSPLHITVFSEADSFTSALVNLTDQPGSLAVSSFSVIIRCDRKGIFVDVITTYNWSV